MGKTFRKINISLAGDFGPLTEKIKQWVEANGGNFSKQLEKDVTTHLITTKDAFQKRNAAGISAYTCFFSLSPICSPLSSSFYFFGVFPPGLVYSTFLKNTNVVRIINLASFNISSPASSENERPEDREARVA